MMKRLLAIATLLTATLGADLPSPYSEIELLPYNGHGWYSNAKQLRQVIKSHENLEVVVEVGCWLGKSTISIARMAPEDCVVYAVDHWEGSGEHQVGKRSHFEFLPYLYEQFLSNVIHAHMTEKIVPMRMSSLEAADLLDVRPNLIYIDASHETVDVLADLEAWYPKLAGDGVICGDDWTWKSVQKAVKIFARRNGLKIQASENFWRLS